MNFFRRFVKRPQKIWARQAIFQIHLWMGLIIGLYLVAVGLSGSILVFKEEAIDALTPKLQQPVIPDHATARMTTIARNLRAAYPQHRIALVQYPTSNTPEFRAVVLRRHPSVAKILTALHPNTGAIIGDVNLTASWLGFVHNLHILLLAGPAGFIANGIGAILLCVLCLSGIILWWPGIKRWKRALTVDFNRSWKRINFDLHSAIGLWLLPLVGFWGLSTIYFVWEGPFTAFVHRASRVTIADFNKPPEYRPGRPGLHADLDRMVHDAQQRIPDTHPIAVMPAAGESVPFVVFMARENSSDSGEIPTHAVRVFFDPTDGRHLETRRPPPNRTAGDWIIWSMKPFHFGTEWGFAMKVVWALLGLSIPVLTITGALMYWNRSLSKLWRKHKRPACTLPVVREHQEVA